MEDIKRLLKDALKKRGYGYLNLQNVFNAADADGNGGLNWNEFQECLKACYLTPSQKDLRAIFRELDRDGNNLISVGEFMAVMREDLSSMRQSLVSRAFNKIDADEDGVITMRDIGAVVNFSAHPEVRNGNMSCMNFMVDFFETLNSVNDSGSFTETDFVDYYSAIAAYDDDEHFIDCITSLWNIRKADVGVGFGLLKIGTSGNNKANDSGGQLNAAQSQEVNFISETMDKLRKKLAARGSRGIVGLQRKMKSMDDDGSKSLNMVEFKKALKEMDLVLTDEEYHTLFDHFDKDRSGSLSFDEFLEGVRGPMNARRTKMVYQAFHVLDKDSRGLIEPSTIMNVYDASKHPDVLSGKKAAEDVLEEFLATFEVGGEVDGKVTRDEFVNYYNNVSSSIDNDDYFELMIRNAWHISGGTGQAANSANKRVLVTHSDGSQSVQEIKDDLGLKADDKVGMIRRLKTQGVDAASISTTDADLNDRDKNALINKIKGSPGDSDDGKLQAHMQSVGAVVIHEDDKKVAMAGPNDAPATPGKGGAKGSPAKTLRQETIPSGISHIITKLLKELKSHGANGFVGLQRKFKIMDDDGSKGLDMSEFKKAMNELKMSLSSADLQALFKYFDTDSSNSISFEEFIQGVREPLNDQRLSLIHMAFDRLDQNGDGTIDGEEIASCYDASKHPEVIAGRKTRTQVLTEFLSTFDVGGVVDGKVTRQEFVNYYHNISASIDNDDYFELMIRNAWHISGGTGQAANSSNKRVLVTHSDGSQSIEEIKNDLGMKPGDKAEMMKRLKLQGLDDIASIASSDADVEKADKLNIKGAKPKGTLKLSSFQNPPAPPSSHLKTSPGLNKVLERVREALKKRGAHGFLGLQRRFRAMDDNLTKSIDLPHFKTGMQTMGLDLNEKELEGLFRYFDTDSSRTINFDEFIVGLRAPLTENRNRLVQMAFSKLDKDGNGTIDGDEIASTYNASQHPDVLAGKRSEREVLTEFMATFEVGGEVDGKVTREEFVNYYTNVGASIDSEDYFELMIRNAWHISGGTGQAANSANKRVLVTHSDGSQSIEVIKNDLGMRADDKAEMMKRLKAQGIDAVSIQSNDVDENGKPLVAGGARQKTFVAKRRIMSMGQGNSTGLPGPNLALPAQSAPTVSPTKKGVVVSNARLQAGSRNKVNRPNTVVRGILEQIQKELYSRGVIGLVSLQRKFRSLMEQGSTGLSIADVKLLLKDWSIHLEASHLRALHQHFDTDNSGGVSFDEFLFNLRPPVSQERLAIVSRAFEYLDPNGNGSIDADTLIAMFNAAGDPSVLSGQADASSVLQQFMETFDVGAVTEGRVTRGEFINYYTNVSIFFNSNSAFQALLQGVWSKKAVVKHARSVNTNETSVVEEKKYEPGTKPSTAGRAAKIAGSMSMQDGTSMKERALTSNIMKDAISEEGSTYGTKATLHGKLPKQLQSIMVKLKHELKSRGARGYVGLQRKFRIMDDDGNKQLNLAEFKKGMTEMNMGLLDSDLRHLFEYFDEDNSGSISSDEFIKGVRDPINERRRSLLDKAFDIMDKDKSGVIDGEDIADAFDASQHPDVLRGKKTAGDVLAEFLATFDVGGVIDGKVTRDEFVNYYTNISASIDNDDYFELMIRNAWHITGGAGWSENSSNRRVLVTHSDGTQSVEEIKNDLGLKADDRKGMIRRLKAQGVDVVDIKLFG